MVFLKEKGTVKLKRDIMNKQISLADALSKVRSGMTVMLGGFLSNGGANTIIDAIVESDVKDLTVICNDTSSDNVGMGKLFVAKKVKRVIASYVGANAAGQEQMNAGTLEVVLVPQGTLAERIRCGGCGLGGVLTQTGLGTLVEEGKQIVEVDGKRYILETPLRADLALIGASVADEAGNLIYKGTSQNFNPLMAMAADVVVAEVDRLVPVGALAPETIHTPGVVVDFIYKNDK